MTRSDLIDRLHGRFRTTLIHDDARSVVSVVLDVLTDTIAAGDRVEIRGFGSFETVLRNPRIGRNPRTGERVAVPAKHVPHFKAGKELRERVDFPR